MLNKIREMVGVLPVGTDIVMVDDPRNAGTTGRVIQHKRTRYAVATDRGTLRVPFALVRRAH